MSFPSQLVEPLLGTVSLGIIILDKHFTVLYLNKFAGDLLDIKVCDSLNKENLELTPYSKVQTIKYQNKTLKLQWQKEKLDKSDVYIGFISDITDYEEQKIKLSFLETIIDHIHEGIIGSNKDGKIFIYNKTSEELEGLSKKDVIGKKSTDIYKVTPENSELLTVLRTQQPLLGVYANFFTKKGKEISLIRDYLPVFRNHEMIGVCGITRNITKIQELLNTTIKLQKQISSHSRKTFNTNSRYSFDDIIGTSESLRKAVSEAKKAAKNHSSVLIVGDTGTGKELFVQSIHGEGSRNKEPFVPINCAAIPETLLESLLFGTVKGTFTNAVDSPGLFQQAANGTLFLDELNAMSLNLQAKLLRVLEERKVRQVGGKHEIPIHCRIISATNQDPLECIKQNTLRRDLYYRLGAITVYIPPLKNRKEDIETFVDYFLKKYNKKYNTLVTSISPDLMDIFMKYDWPGNVRELQHLIESAFMMIQNEKTIKLEHLPSYFYKQFLHFKKHFPISLNTKSHSLAKILQQAEEQAILQALSEHGGNITKATNSLGIARQNLHYRIRKLGININTLKKQPDY